MQNSQIIGQRATSNSHNYAQSQKIHIALSVYDPKGTYSQHAGVVMTSIFENTKSPVRIYILHDETLTQDNREKFLRTAEKYNQEVIFINVTEYAKKIQGEALLLFQSTFSIGTAYRLFIPDLINLEKIIYLDCDIAVNLDIKELWEIDVNDYYVAAVMFYTNNNIVSRIRRKINGFPSDNHSYCNAGIMVMNLKNIRKLGNLFEISYKWLKRHLHSSPNADNDILDIIFLGHIKPIDERLNYRVDLHTGVELEQLNNCIIHTTARPKLWEINGLPAQYIYWNYYLKSAWGENKTREEIVKTLLDASRQETQKTKYNIFVRIYCRACNEIRRTTFGQVVALLYNEFLYRIGLKK